ncbi:MAG: hypothetical protein AB3N23_00115 [Paracoccaceae bacterium]
MSDPAVGFLDHARKLGPKPGRFALDDLIWPLGQPERLRGGTLRDLAPSDHLVLPPRTTNYIRPGYGTRAKTSVMVLEPEIVQARHIPRLQRFHWRFHRVLTYYPALLTSLPNALFLPFGSTWVPEWRDLQIEKTRLMSVIASAKRSQPGHYPRHSTIAWALENGMDLDALGGGYKPFEHKRDGLAPYMYSVVIENVREENYFTEKLIDAILCDTVPIYWGCPNIADFLDTGGLILCETEKDIRAAVQGASIEQYASLLPKLTAIKEQADHWGRTFERAALALLDT